MPLTPHRQRQPQHVRKPNLNRDTRTGWRALARRRLLQLLFSIGRRATSRTNHDEPNSDEHERGHDQHDHGKRTAGFATDRHAPVSSHGPIIPPTPRDRPCGNVQRDGWPDVLWCGRGQ